MMLDEKAKVVEKFHHLKSLKFSPILPKAFTEKGLYMLATILKSSRATSTTLAIIETFSKMKELSRIVTELSNTTENNRQKPLIQKSGDIITDLLHQDHLSIESETTFELNFAVLRLKHTIKRNDNFK
jgi:hypothetical protein